MWLKQWINNLVRATILISLLVIKILIKKCTVYLDDNTCD